MSAPKQQRVTQKDLAEAEDLDFGDDAIVMMTAKDAVKCRAFAKSNYYYLSVCAELEDDFWQGVKFSHQT